MSHARHLATCAILLAAGCGFAPTLVVECEDGVKNGAEADVDCGGGCPNACAEGASCLAPADCASLVCVAGACLGPSCEDGVRNGDEADVDCGLSCDRPCADHRRCAEADDCASGVCGGGRCLEGTCADGVENATESDVDCGGGCQSCDNGQDCVSGDDCASRACVRGSCSAWVRTAGPMAAVGACDTGGHEARAVDSEGNVFAAGNLEGPLSLGGATLDPALGDTYLARYAATGEHVWSRNVGPAAFGTHPTAAAFDPSGNVFVAGVTEGADLGGGFLQGPGIFVAKYSVSGGHLWSNVTSVASGSIQSLAVDAQGNVVLAGFFADPSITFGSTVLSNTSATSRPFVAELAHGDGSASWAVAPAVADDQTYPFDMAIDGDGDVVVTGYVAGRYLDFGCGLHDALYVSNKGFVAKLEGATGACMWSILDARTTDGVFGTGVVVDATGNVVVAGPIDTTLGNPGLVVDKYSGADGTPIWSKPPIAGVVTSAALHMALDVGGNVVIAGRYAGAAPDFGGGPLVNAGAGTHDVFVLELRSADGAHVHSRRYGGTGDDFARGLGVSPATGGAVLLGLFQDSADFGTGAMQAASPCSAFFLGMGSLPDGST